jgi:hypothetical protein
LEPHNTNEANRHHYQCQPAKAEPEQPPCAENAQPMFRIQANSLRRDYSREIISRAWTWFTVPTSVGGSDSTKSTDSGTARLPPGKSILAEKSLVERLVILLVMPRLHPLVDKSLVRPAGGSTVSYCRETTAKLALAVLHQWQAHH